MWVGRAIGPRVGGPKAPDSPWGRGGGSDVGEGAELSEAAIRQKRQMHYGMAPFQITPGPSPSGPPFLVLSETCCLSHCASVGEGRGVKASSKRVID